MTGRRINAAVLCLLTALAFAAIIAPGANATTVGTTAYTCAKKVPEGGAGFSKEHCKAGDAVSSGAKFQHVAIAENTTTELTGNESEDGGKHKRSLDLEDQTHRQRRKLRTVGNRRGN